MVVGIMTTDNGPHSPEKWAMATAERIFFPGPEVEGERLLAAKKLQLTIADSLVKHHSGAMTRERAALTANAAPRLTRVYEHDRDEALAETKEVLTDIQAAAKGTPWEAHWSDPKVHDAAAIIIASDLMTVKDIERGWHKARNGKE